MGKAILFSIQVLAVAAITVSHYVVGTINRHYFPEMLPTVWDDMVFATVISLIWLGPAIVTWLWKRVKAS